MPANLNSPPLRLARLCLCALLAFSAACNRQESGPGDSTAQSGAKRYALKGNVVSVDKDVYKRQILASCTNMLNPGVSITLIFVLPHST